MEFRGTDRKTVKDLKTSLQRALTRDSAIPTLSPRTKRSATPIIDPADVALVTAATAIVNRCTALLAL